MIRALLYLLGDCLETLAEWWLEWWDDDGDGDDGDDLPAHAVGTSLLLVMTVVLLFTGHVTATPSGPWSDIKYFTPADFIVQEEDNEEIEPSVISMELVGRLDKVRAEIDLPIVILSGYRSVLHNRRVGGAPNSAHLRGLAADIKCPNSRFRYLFLVSAVKYFTRIGIGNGFIHVDCDPSLSQGVVWTYTAKKDVE